MAHEANGLRSEFSAKDPLPASPFAGGGTLNEVASGGSGNAAGFGLAAKVSALLIVMDMLGSSHDLLEPIVYSLVLLGYTTKVIK